MAFSPTLSVAYLSSILLSERCYPAFNVNSIQTRTPSLGQVFPLHSRPLHPSMQVLYVIGMTFIAIMGSSDFS